MKLHHTGNMKERTEIRFSGGHFRAGGPWIQQWFVRDVTTLIGISWFWGGRFRFVGLMTFGDARSVNEPDTSHGGSNG